MTSSVVGVAERAQYVSIETASLLKYTSSNNVTSLNFCRSGRTLRFFPSDGCGHNCAPPTRGWMARPSLSGWLADLIQNSVEM